MPNTVSPAPTTSTDVPDPVLAAALTSAALACHQAIVDYRSGLLDDAEVERTLVRCGLVITAGEAWLLDVDGARWWRYRGAAPTAAYHQPRPAAVPFELST